MVNHTQNCLSLFDHLVRLALNELTSMSIVVNMICCDINNISSQYVKEKKVTQCTISYGETSDLARTLANI